jgi:hypothetical protein
MEDALDNEFFAEIMDLCKKMQEHAKIVIRGLESETSSVIRSRSRDEKRIEHLLDRLMDYSVFEEGLPLFKRLLRYYYHINPEVTCSYVMFYREMYDSEEEGDRLYTQNQGVK